MFPALSGDCLAAEVQMLLASDSVRACLIGPPLEKSVCFLDTKSFPISEPVAFRDCLYWLRRSNTIQLRNVRDTLLSEHDYFIAYRRADRFTGDNATKNIEIKSVAQFASCAGSVLHLTVSEVDAPIINLSKSAHISQLQSLDISRLQLDNDSVVSLVQSTHFRNLRWLDLSGNSNISFSSVRVIAEAVSNGRFPCLQWIDLLGTDCDATPYVDGRYWRISDLARSLANEFGYQPWMMLGSRIPELENRELLTSIQRQVPPDRFS